MWKKIRQFLCIHNWSEEYDRDPIKYSSAFGIFMSPEMDAKLPYYTRHGFSCIKCNKWRVEQRGPFYR